MAEIVDVTLREAGLANGFSFTLDQVTEIARALDQAGVDVIEVGYLRRWSPGAPRSGSAVDAEYLGAIRRVVRRARLAVMIHTAGLPLDAYGLLRELKIDLIRFTLSGRNADELSRHAEAARALGLPFTLNATRTTELGLEVVLDYARMAERLGASAFYLADSNGSLLPEALERLAGAVRGAVSLPLGFHAHDNLTLAFANTLIALRHGFALIDASLGGAGKGGGNLATELIAGHLRVHHGARYDVFPLFRAYAAQVAPTVPQGPRDRILQHAFGLLDLNIDRIAQLHDEAGREQVPVEELLHEQFGLR